MAARTLGSSAFRAIIALTYAAFARLYDRYDIVLGVELANRSDARAKQVIGLMARPLPMLLTLDRTMTIADAVRQIDETRAQNYPHRHFPIQELARELEITRKGRYGLFDVIVNYIPAAYDFAFEDLPVELHQSVTTASRPRGWLRSPIAGPARDLDVTIDTDPGLIPPDMAALIGLLRRDPAAAGHGGSRLPTRLVADHAGGNRETGSGLRRWRDRRIAGRRNACHALRRTGRTFTRTLSP